MKRLLAAASLALSLVVGCDPLAPPPGEWRMCCPDGKTVPKDCPADSCEEGEGWDWWPDLSEPT